MLEGESEIGAAGRMWCHCCAKEVEKHVTDTNVSIEWAGLLEHLAALVHSYYSLTRIALLCCT